MRTIEEAPSGVPQTANDRATSFQAVQGGQEHYKGETLLVSAYAVLWALVLAWVAFIWRKQGEMNGRLLDLERILDKAAADRAAAKDVGS